ISVVAIFTMGFYLGRYAGSFRPIPHELEQPAGAAGRASLPGAAPQGAEIYSAICLPCHQAGGAGVEGKYPPLAGSEWPVKDAGIPARIVLNGLEGPIQVKGKTYVNQMPALGPQLQDDEIAAVLTFVRSSWGNHADKVSMEFVGGIRKQIAGLGPWTAEKLNALGEKK
ncbi:MAG: cytochrome c, partial [Acidobacteriia bacterium]|nr:cytochrome c [Terriglobia bacterium]